jgi:hypothetical protein
VDTAVTGEVLLAVVNQHTADCSMHATRGIISLPDLCVLAEKQFMADVTVYIYLLIVTIMPTPYCAVRPLQLTIPPPLQMMLLKIAATLLPTTASARYPLAPIIQQPLKTSCA